MTGPEPVTDLSLLTGLRSSKSTYYPQYRGAAERLERVVHALDLVSRALTRTVEGPETLICAVAEAARAHLNARWVVVALTDASLPGTGPRRLVLGPDASPFLVGEVEGPPLPDDVLACLEDVRSARFAAEQVIEPHYAFVPIESVDGAVGALAAWTDPRRTLDATDGAVLSILASQTAVALQNSATFQDARRTAADLAVRNAELEATQRRLGAAHRHQVLDEERHRIARELHDSVTQAVLSAGMQIEVCRNDIPESERRERLDLAKDLTRRAVEQLRSAIYSLGHAGDAERSSLPDMLDQLSVVHMPDELQVVVDIDGTPEELPGDVEHAILRIAGEALFNAAVHSDASHAALDLRYRRGTVTLVVSDDGDGDPATVRTAMRLADSGDLGGAHRGLVNMATRARELGGHLDVGRSRLGGIEVAATIPTGGQR